MAGSLTSERLRLRPRLFGPDCFGLVFAIEDVVMRDGQLCPGAADLIRWLLTQESIPFVFVTNSDGFRDAAQKDTLLRELQNAESNVQQRRVLVREKPFARVLEQAGLANQHVLIIGDGTTKSIRNLAGRCGFRRNKVWTPESLGKRSDVDIRAVLVWSNRRDWDAVLDVVDPFLSQSRPRPRPDPETLLLICTDDFARATGSRHATVDSHFVMHLLDSRSEPRRPHADRPRTAVRWAEKWQVPPVDNGGQPVYHDLEMLLDEFNLTTSPSPGPIQTVYLMTDALGRDASAVERHQNRTVGGPKWKLFAVGGDASGQEDPDLDGQGRHHRADGVFPDLVAAVRAALGEWGITVPDHIVGQGGK